MLRVASALRIEGRLRRRSRWRSKAWRPAAKARNRSPGRSGTPSARHYDLAARSSLHGSGGNAGDGSTGPRPKIATVERREARVPPLGDDKAPRKRLACRAKARSCASWTRFGTLRVPLHPSAVSALRHPSGVDEGKVQTPGANAPRERTGLFDIVKLNRRCAVARR